MQEEVQNLPTSRCQTSVARLDGISTELMTTTAAISSLPDINARILTLRDQKVILDSDLACIYGAEVRALLQAVKRNPDRFPLEFVFQLAPEELALLRSQTVISKADKTLLLQDGALRDIYQKLRPLLEAPPAPSKPEIGFHVKEDAAPYRTKGKTIRVSLRQNQPGSCG